MVGIFSSISHKTFTIVLAISLIIMIVFQFKNEEFELVNIYNTTKVNEEGYLQGVIDRTTNKIYASNEHTIEVLSDYDLSDEKSVKANFPEIVEIGNISKFNITQLQSEPNNWIKSQRGQWTRANVKDYTLAIFLLLLFIYCIAYLPSFIRSIRDKTNNNSMVPFSYKEHEDQKNILNFTCNVCQDKQFPKIIKEEYVESMQFLYTECLNCQNQNKERLK